MTGHNYTPSVIEPSFGIGRIMYCLFEHSFYVREDDAAKLVFGFKPAVAPVKATVFPLQADARFDKFVGQIHTAIIAKGLAVKVDTTGVRRNFPTCLRV